MSRLKYTIVMKPGFHYLIHDKIENQIVEIVLEEMSSKCYKISFDGKPAKWVMRDKFLDNNKVIERLRK